jgi:LSD1 subclass zinc finger protein
MSEHNPEDFQPNSKLLEKMLQMPCPTCASELTYSAEKKMLSCRHCGHTQDYEKAKNLVRERPLAEAAAAMDSFSPEEAEKQVVECDSCRAQLMIASTDVAVRCNFCGSEKVNKAAFKKNIIQPQGIIPFKVAKQEGLDKFKKWIAEGWFRPNKLKALAAIGDLHGIYLPFWTFDADSYSEWEGEQGTYYYVDVERNGKTERERRTRWKWRNGNFDKHFDDVLILASGGATIGIVEGIYPYNLGESINYNPTLMVGWEAQIYNIEIDKGYDLAEKKMDAENKAEASRRLGGDTQRNLQVDTDYYDQTFKHLILPVWLCTYMYKGKAYQFAINGQTGKINGQKPFSWVKIFFFVLFIAAIIGVIVFFANKE